MVVISTPDDLTNNAVPQMTLEAMMIKLFRIKSLFLVVTVLMSELTSLCSYEPLFVLRCRRMLCFSSPFKGPVCIIYRDKIE